ncbi:MAG: hypothetical protein FWC16_08150 [Defluviitaleaceae bacterium]|nr:hypothetical protein [Defluviitaleaceae bacterium]MCL2274884.1 hypothetical protein [Defluviitaleaceae bacterium]
MNLYVEIQRFFNELFSVLNRQDNHIVILAVYLCIAVAVIILRIMAKVRFGAALMAFRRDAREIKGRDDVKKFRNALLRNTVAAYKSVADKAVSRIPTNQLIERQVQGISILGWRFTSLAAFIEGFESGLLWVGLLLAVVFADFAHVYGVAAVAVFLLMRVFIAFFDFRATRSALCDELHIYIEREVGRFYASDSGGAVLRLKTELAEAQNRQTEALSAALAQLTTALTANAANLGKSISETTKGINTQIAEAINATLPAVKTEFDAGATAWQNALAEAAAIQTATNNAASGMEKAGGKLQSAAELLATHLQGHSAALSDQLLQLVRAVDAVKAQQDALIQQAQYIESNQQTLEKALHSYEEAIQHLTQNMGERLGAFINLHAQNSAQVVNDALRGNIERIVQISQREGGGAANEL